MSQDTGPSPRDAVLTMWSGFILSRALQVAAELGIADLLVEGPSTPGSLAAETGAQEDHLRRLLRALASHGVFGEDAGRFHLTPLAEVLRSDVPRSIRDVVRTYDESLWNAFANLEYSVMTGKPAFERTAGTPYYSYLADHSEAGDRWSRGMASLSALENSRIVRAYDFSDAKTVIDVGGGQGGFIGEVLKANAHLRGVLFDQAHVVANPVAIQASGVADRCEIRSGDFFESVPSACDFYILKRVLGFDDDRCVRILRVCRAAMPAHGRLLGIDALVSPGNTSDPGRLFDIMLMVQGDGRARTETEYRELYRRAGFELIRVVPTRSTLSILEGVPA